MFTRKMRNLALVLATATVAWSCGDMGQSPVSSTDPASDVAAFHAANEQSPVAGVIVFTPRALAAAKRGKKSADNATGSDARMMKQSRGGDLEVKFKKYTDKGELQVKKAKFRVQKQSINPVFPSFNDEHLISMKVESGTTLDDIAIKFWPSGMTFDPGAELEVQLQGDLGETGPVGYHISEGGRVSKVATKVEKKRGTYTLKITVPGFSEYSWDDGDDTDIDPTMEDGSCWGCNGSPH